MLKLNSVTTKSQRPTECTLVVETNDNNKYEIVMSNNEDCKFYINALTYLAQLVKCKAYAYKGIEKLKIKAGN